MSFWHIVTGLLIAARFSCLMGLETALGLTSD